MLVLHSQNKGRSAQSAFLLNPSDEVLKYNLVLASPAFASGFSIESDFTDNVNVLSEMTLGVFELINFARRFRTSTNIRFYLTQKPTYDYTPEQIESQFEQCDKLAVEFDNKKQLFNANQALSMRWALIQQGFKVEVIASDAESLSKGSRQFNELNSQDAKARVDAILASPGITKAEVESLTVQNCITFADQARIKRYELEMNYQKSAVTKSDIHFDDKFCNKVLFKHLWSDDTEQRSKGKSEYEKAAMLLNKIVLKNNQYHGSDGVIRLTRKDSFDIAQQIYVNRDVLIHCTKSIRYSDPNTQRKATTLVRKLLTSLGYYCPDYTGQIKTMRVRLDDRANTYREHFC